MSENVIFCYSGTGNCLDLAKNIAKTLGDTDIIMMRSKPAKTSVTDAKRVGFVFPCYGGGAPEDVLKYAQKVKVDPRAYTFAVSQSASYKGTGLARLNKIIPLRYWKAVTHQCSCIWLFPHTLMIPKMNADEAQARSERLAGEIGKELLDYKVIKKKPFMNPLNVFENMLWPKIAKAKSSHFEVSSACVSCGQCEKLCPRDNIKLVNGKPVFGNNCIQCLGCLQYCPESAISIGKITDKREHYHNSNVSASDLCEKIIHID